MTNSKWELLSVVLCVLGFIVLVSGITGFEYGYQQFAILIVFGGIFLIFGIGLLVMSIWENDLVVQD